MTIGLIFRGHSPCGSRLMLQLYKEYMTFAVNLTDGGNVHVSVAEASPVVKMSAQAIAQTEATLATMMLKKCEEQDKEACLQEYFEKKGWQVRRVRSQ